jgi:2-dehydro-3-deoxy-D-arabinonate dehydratase
VYALGYDAERPEVFFKSVGRRVSGPQQQLGIREDSTVDVPEPELAFGDQPLRRGRRIHHLQ